MSLLAEVKVIAIPSSTKRLKTVQDLTPAPKTFYQFDSYHVAFDMKANRESPEAKLSFKGKAYLIEIQISRCWT